MVFSLHSIELKRVILSTDDNPFYKEFWPVVAKCWESMGIRPTLVFIAEEGCEIDATLGDVFRFDPVPGITKAMQAQVYRLFLPSLFPEEGCIISDIDMIPISRSYFVDGAARCPDRAFLIYRDAAFGPVTNQYPMCYIAGKGKVFSALFQVAGPSQFAERIQEWNSIVSAWETDQIMLYRKVKEWERIGGPVVRLRHKVGPRIDRELWQENLSVEEIMQHIDCHCPRPYSAYKGSIDRIAQTVMEAQ